MHVLRRHLAAAATLAAVAALAAGCAAGGAPTADPTVTIDVAALTLAGVGDAVWDLEVSAPGGVVVQRRITSSAYGDGAGSASFVAPCDATPGANENTVRVWIAGLYPAAVSAEDAGPFASGAAPAALAGAALPFQNPTASAPLERTVPCAPNADNAVRFDVTLLRPASQGFFDVAVAFDDLFCSAKLDCCREVDGGACEDIDLLHDPASGGRDRTVVLGFACTAGPDNDVVTALYLDDLVLDCDVNSDGDSFVADLTLDPAPTASPGNLCPAAAGAMSGCDAVTEESAGVDADAYLFQIAAFRGEEQLTSGASPARKVYWNVALGVRDAIAGCRLRTRGTVDDANDAGDHVDAGVIGAGVTYPVVVWDADLGACRSEPLTLGDASAPVRAEYATAGEPFDHVYAPGFACVPACEHGGSCVAANTCLCDGTGWTGPLCADGLVGDDATGRRFADGTYAPTCLAYLEDPRYTGPARGDGVYVIEPSEGETLRVFCDMTTEGGGWVDVVASYHAAGADAAALEDAFWDAGADPLVTAAATSDGGTDGVLVRTTTLGSTPAFFLTSPFTFGSARLDYRMQGADDGTRCAGLNFIPLNGPGYDGGYDNYTAACPSGLVCIQGRPRFAQDAPIAVTGYAIDGLDAATVLTWSGWTLNATSSTGCARDPEIPSADAALFVTRLLLREGDPVGAVCTGGCDHGGSCVAPETCDCADTGWSGGGCATFEGVVGDDAGGRAFADGSRDASCLAYRYDRRNAGVVPPSGEYWLEPALGQVLKVWCDMTTEGGGWVDVVKSFADAGADEAALTDAYFYGGGDITGSYATATPENGVVLLSTEVTTHKVAYYLTAPTAITSARLSYWLQGGDDGTRCSTTTSNWVPLNGPGFDGGYSTTPSYAASCPVTTCIQGRPEYLRDAPIHVTSYTTDALSAATILTWSGSNYGPSVGCVHDAKIPTNTPALFVTKLLVR
ncbi:MAG: hypothetical protein H6745_21500 [Deltaproteobacteria bacterium]|nr:hypothetical protein [Deltaproteobacteria bacterium]